MLLLSDEENFRGGIRLDDQAPRRCPWLQMQAGSGKDADGPSHSFSTMSIDRSFAKSHASHVPSPDGIGALMFNAHSCERRLHGPATIPLRPPRVRRRGRTCACADGYVLYLQDGSHNLIPPARYDGFWLPGEHDGYLEHWEKIASSGFCRVTGLDQRCSISDHPTREPSSCRSLGSRQHRVRRPR
jgi:hypothetical protein